MHPSRSISTEGTHGPFVDPCGGRLGGSLCPRGSARPRRAGPAQFDRAFRHRRLHPACWAAPRFHIERIAPNSAAEKDQLRPHDLIVKIDGEPIRSIDHLRAALAEAFADDGEVTITYTRGVSLAHHDLHCNVKKAPAKTAKKRKAEPDIEIR